MAKLSKLCAVSHKLQITQESTCNLNIAYISVHIRCLMRLNVL